MKNCNAWIPPGQKSCVRAWVQSFLQTTIFPSISWCVVKRHTQQNKKPVGLIKKGFPPKRPNLHEAQVVGDLDEHQSSEILGQTVYQRTVNITHESSGHLDSHLPAKKLLAPIQGQRRLVQDSCREETRTTPKVLMPCGPPHISRMMQAGFVKNYFVFSFFFCSWNVSHTEELEIAQPYNNTAKNLKNTQPKTSIHG